MTSESNIINPNIPGSFFSTHGFADAKKYPAWREAIQGVFMVEPVAEETLLNFETSLESYMLGSMMISRTISTTQTFRRTAENIASHAADYLMIEIMQEGSHVLETEKGEKRVQTGDIVLYDMQQEYAFKAQGVFNGTRYQYSDMDFVFPLDSIRPLVPHIEHLHRHVIPKDTLLNSLLSNHLLTLYDQLPQMTREVVATVSQCTAELIAGLLCIDPQLELATHDNKEKNQLAIIYGLIMDNLDSPALNIDFFCRELNMSKSSLYRMCEPYGGIMKMVRVRRLRTAYNILMEPSPPQITQLAMQCGYSSLDSFTRAFKKEFGFNPSELLHNTSGPSILKLQRPDYRNLLQSFTSGLKT